MKKKYSHLCLAATFALLSFFLGATPSYGQIPPQAAGDSSAAVKDSVLRLTLEDALYIALNDNPNILIADRNITKQQYARRGTYAQLFPQINASSSYQRTLKKQAMTMTFGDATQKIEVGTFNNIAMGVQASMPVVNAQLWESLKITGLQVEAAIEQARSSKLSMVEQVTNAFYSVLLAEDVYAAYMQAYRNALDNYDNVKNSYEVGKTSQYDLMRSQVSVANAEPNVYSSENALYLAQWQLKALMAIDLDTEIDCEGTLSDYIPLIESSYPEDSVSLAGNSDLKLLQNQRMQLESNLRMQKRAYLPTLSLSFSFSYFTMDDSFKFDSWNPYSVVGLSLSIPIFSGGQRYAAVKQAEITLDNASLQIEDTERSLRLALMQYLNIMRTSAKQYRAAQSGIEQAGKGYDIAVKRYQAGSGTLLEINDSQLALTQAQLNMSQSVYNWLKAKTSLEKTEGQYITE